MKAEEVPEEWVEAGARAMVEKSRENGWLAVPWDEFSEPQREDARSEVAAALAAVIPQVKAAALREAAEGIQALHPGEVKASVEWLRARADREADQ